MLGYERFREQEERSTFANVSNRAGGARGPASGSWTRPMLQTFTRIFFGAMSSAGESVGTSADPAAAAALVESAIAYLLSGVQMLVAAGSRTPSRARAASRRLVAEPGSPETPRALSLRGGYLPKVTSPFADRDQLDPGPAGRHGQLAALGRRA